MYYVKLYNYTGWFSVFDKESERDRNGVSSTYTDYKVLLGARLRFVEMERVRYGMVQREEV